MDFPTDITYSKEHVWARSDGKQLILGITDYAQSQLTDIVFAELPEAGKMIRKGDVIAQIESVKSVSDLLSPVSGKIVEVNPKVSESPEIINQDPYGEGWLIQVESDEKPDMMDAEEYKKIIE